MSSALAGRLWPRMDEPRRRAPTLRGKEWRLDAVLERSQWTLASLRPRRADTRYPRAPRRGRPRPNLHLLGLTRRVRCGARICSGGRCPCSEVRAIDRPAGLHPQPLKRLRVREPAAGSLRHLAVRTRCGETWNCAGAASGEAEKRWRARRGAATIARVLPGLDVAPARHLCEPRVPPRALHRPPQPSHRKRRDDRRTSRALARGLRPGVDEPKRRTPTRLRPTSGCLLDATATRAGTATT